MSSALYPGWLFAEQTSTLTGQLDAGVRALLIDTHYGAPSTARLPGSETTVVITDRAAELAAPPGESYDPAIAATGPAGRGQRPAPGRRPSAASTSATTSARWARCRSPTRWSRCASGSRPTPRRWSSSSSRTTPLRPTPSAALEAAGLADRAWTLDPTQPMPTLGDLVDAGKNLLVFAENAGPGSPDWYQSAYQWFQETPYAWTSVDDMTCAPNRGASDNKLMLINHWVGYSPPDPGKAGSLVNNSDELKARDRAVHRRSRRVAQRRRRRLRRAGRPGEDGRGLQRRRSRAASATSARAARTSRPRRRAPLAGSTVVHRRPWPRRRQHRLAVRRTDRDHLADRRHPEQFCAAVDPFVAVMTAWALADLSKPAAAGGLPALAYGPAVDQTIRGLEPSAPREIDATPGRGRRPVRRRGRRPPPGRAPAVGHRRDGRRRARPALRVEPRRGAGRAAGPQILYDKLGRDGTIALAQSFDRAHPTVGAVFDLGDVSTEVAVASGYGCLVGS